MKFNKIIKLIIAFLSLIALLVVVGIGLAYNVTIRNAMSENITLNNNIIIFIILLLLIIAILFILFNKLSGIEIKYKSKKLMLDKNIKRLIFLVLLVLFAIIQIIWINVRDANPNYDQYYVYNTAVEMSQGEWDNLTQKEYLEIYPQQISLASFYALILKIFNTTSIKALQYLNVVANIFIVLGLYLITNIIANKENTKNSIAFFVMAITFTPLIFLSTFIYGDLISLAFVTFAIYFVIKYNKLEKIRYLIISAIFMSLSYFFRMNMLIFFIAICIYLFLELIKYASKVRKKSSLKENKEIIIKNDKIKNNKIQIVFKVLLILIYAIISIVPTTIFKSYMQEKLKLDKNGSFPIIGFIDLGISNSTRGPGWYVDSFIDTWKIDGHDTEPMKRRIQNQLTNFAENPSECFWFYIVKIASMWNENTFGSIWYNLSFNFGNMSVNEGQATEEQVSNYNKVDNFIYNNYNLFVMYDKIIVMFIYVAVLLFILRNKNISNEQILPILIFLGGFLFHIFWEGKSRYVMPYVVMLIPIASIGIKENIQWIGTKVNKTKNKFNKKTKDKI